MNIPADVAIQTGRTPRRKTRVAAVLAVGSVVAIAFGCIYRLPSPDGVYYDPYIGSIGDAYWVFEKGRLVMRTPESGPEEFLGTYAIEGGRWVMQDKRGQSHQMHFTATVLGIKLYDPSRQEPDRFMFRRSFAWLPKLREWAESHRQ